MSLPADMPVPVPPPLDVRGLTKSFGGFRAVDGVSLTVRANEIHALIGPNGAGKSSLIGCLAGALRADAGTIALYGADVTRLPLHRRVRKGLARSFQITSIFQEMTVEDNVRSAVAAVHDWTWAEALMPASRHGDVNAQAEAILARLGLGHRRAALAAELSHGEQRRLELGLALASGGSMLLLDEPTAGMGVDDIRGMTALIDGLRQTCSLLLVEHNMGLVLGISDRITVLRQGAVIASGTPDEIRRNETVKAAYLGRKAGDHAQR
ncbi:MAG: ABC transporter ATP-binding protein [Hyphomonadaceae bacterium]|nr:ABC transporter ATP-binding protein [Hyphomonadaceae bacterium]